MNNLTDCPECLTSEFIKIKIKIEDYKGKMVFDKYTCLSIDEVLEEICDNGIRKTYFAAKEKKLVLDASEILEKTINFEAIDNFEFDDEQIDDLQSLLDDWLDTNECIYYSKNKFIEIDFNNSPAIREMVK